MMGLPCLRVDGAFFAALDQRRNALIVKLTATEVAARVAGGRGQPFAPAGRVFREWVTLDGADPDSWRAALGDALGFVRGR
jgi:hypothetical protein